MLHKFFTLIDDANREDSLGSITGFLCLQILSHIDVEFSLLWRTTNHKTMCHELSKQI